jgi:hypothetical protein
MVEALIDGYGLFRDDAALLRSAALPNVSRTSPYVQGTPTFAERRCGVRCTLNTAERL